MTSADIPTHRPPLPPPNGVLVIDKPLGRTSTDMVRVVKRRVMNAGVPKSVKVGHGGTLDPLATGIVVILVGKATKLCEGIMGGEKRYLTEIDLAHVSTTDDGEGQISPVAVERPPELDEVRRACEPFIGTIMQRPPVYSAIKIGGQPAYNFARRGKELTIEARPVVVYAIDLLEYRWPMLRLDIRSGRGVYIRSLARDLGVSLKTGGMLTGLRRTQVGQFTLADAVTVEAIPEQLREPDLIPIERIRSEPRPDSGPRE